QFVATFGRACWGKGYSWDMARVKALADLDPTDSRNDGVHDELLRAQEALSPLSRIKKARAAASDQKQQAKRFRDIAKSAGFKLHAVVAMALLTTRDDSQVGLTITSGDKTLFDRTDGQAKDLPEDP